MGALRVGTSANALYDVPNPTAIKFGYKDISSADAGRTNDANVTMHKNTVARKVTIALTWKGLGGAAASAVMQAFRPEYFYVRYFDAEENAYVIRRFYAGDKSADVGTYHPNSSFQIGGVTYETISFNIIEV